MTEWPPELNAYRFFLGERIESGEGDRAALRLDHAVLTYSEVDRLTSGFAAALLDLGVGPGDRVLIVAPDSAHFVAALFATMRLGAVVVMVNPGLTADSMRSIVDRSQAAAAVVHPTYLDGYLSGLGEWRPQLLDPTGVDEEGSGPDPAPTRPDDPAIWLFSGGTTGEPKAVPQTHKSLVNTTRRYGQATLGLTADDITISVPKLFFGYATGSNLLFPFSVGASAVLFEAHPTPANVLDRVRRHRPTVLVTVPSAVNQMLNEFPDAGDDLAGLRVATSAGEALPDTLYERWTESYGVELLDGLGTAEMWHIFISNTPGQVKPGTLGRVVPGFEIKACDEQGQQVPADEVGRLWVRGESLGLGYFGDDEQTKEAFRGEWFVGGDLVSIDDDGYVTHRGRADDAAKVKGKWFRPQEVESTLLQHPRVADCAVVTVADDSGLTRPVAFVVAGGEVDKKELSEWVLARLEPYKHPRRIFLVDELPKTHLGKVDRSALKEAARG